VSQSKLAAAVAKVAIATTFGGPLGGSAAAAAAGVDLLASWLLSDSSPTYESTLGRIELGLEQLAHEEKIDPRQVEQALTAACDILMRHGLDAHEIANLNMSPERVSVTVLGRAIAELRSMDESADQLCRHAIRTVYSTMLASPEALPELQRAFQQVALSRLSELLSQPNEVLVSLKAALGSATIIAPRLEWSADRFPPSALLRPEFAIVPFYGRERDLADLLAWTESDPSVSVRLYTGPGGIGKTRLMIECCNRLTSSWRAGFLNREVSSSDWSLALDAPFESNQRLFVVIDYAETRKSEVVSVIRRALARSTKASVRVVLLARATGDWWRGLQGQSDVVGQFLVGPSTSILALAPVASDSGHRRELFTRAAESFASKINGARVPSELPALDADHYKRALYLLITALAAVEGKAVDGEAELLDFALSREQDFLDDGIVAAGFDGLTGRPILQCAAVATMAGTAADRGQATRLLSRAPLLSGQPPLVVDRVAELLHRLYPGDAWLQGVQPDLLGERVVEQALRDDPSLAPAMFSSAG
jgi:hypothetical protein